MGKILIVEDEFVIAEDLRMILERAGYEIAGIVPSVPKALEIINLIRPSWVFLDIYLTGKLTGIDLAKRLLEMGIPFIYISANSNESVLEAAKVTRPYGFLVKPFREKDVLVTLEIAKYRHENDLEMQLLNETEVQDQVMRIFAESGNRDEEILKVITVLQTHIPFDFLTVCWKHNAGLLVRGHVFFKIEGDNKFELMSHADFLKKIGKTQEALKDLKKYSAETSKSVKFTGNDFVEMCWSNSFEKLMSRSFGLRSEMVKTFQISDWGRLNFSFYSRNKDEYKAWHMVLLDRLDLLLIKLADYFPHIKDAGKILSDKPLNSDLPFNISPLDKLSSNNKLDEDSYGLIGHAPEFRKVKDQVTVVAPFDVSVLILGESGTGKERIAQAIHSLSERKAKPMVKVNCAAIPASLIESELFGYEKGAFTGAFDRRIGKFEQANGGTIFLDEIGELPFELQVKLLCVLQEKEIVRLGGNQILKTDVRIIAATNRNLEKAVAEGTFRLDLFYRLNVFPISLPPLCNRREDIPALVDHFLNKLSGLVDQDKKKFSPKAMRALTDYDWPGNIRELENIVERSLIVNRANKILEVELPVHHKDDQTGSTLEGKVKTIKELEKEHILEVLKKCNGKVAGAGGAAEMLDLPPNTLVAKIKRLGIVKDYL